MEIDFKQFTGKKVRVVHNLEKPNAQGHMAEEIEGTVQVGNALGLLIKPKGRTMSDLIEADKIESVDEIVSAPKQLKAKALKDVTLENARQHLLDRHGWLLTEANKISDKEGLERHDDLAHDNLGHTHGESSDTGDNA